MKHSHFTYRCQSLGPGILGAIEWDDSCDLPQYTILMSKPEDPPKCPICGREMILMAEPAGDTAT